ncbi:MAG: Asp-tRNA(Asn)/Glu-tRNA(Gln) amidotransferase subunit GatB [Alphaproteobacteria bacterium]
MSDAKQRLIAGKTGLWEMVIGLEVHAQITSSSKLFSGASTAFGGEPNTQVSFLDAAFPGMLPVINQVCVEQAVRTGIGLNGDVRLTSAFDRKNYFYADLPSGYQITQFKKPIVENGYLDIESEPGTLKRVRINRLHLEQDAGKSFHDLHPTQSLIDLNRAGIALMEIVSEPDMRTAEEAALYVKKLRALLRYLETCDGNMEEGSLRVDANVSVRKPGEPLGTRVEVKNVNSIKFLQQAILYEAARQIALLEAHGSVFQETRLFDANKGETRSMRKKEEAHDYRYFPDPDLPPLCLSQEFVEDIRRTLPELPEAKKQRLMETLGLSAYDADVLVAEKETAAFFETTLALSKHPPQTVAKNLANWMMGDLFAALNRDGVDLERMALTPGALAKLMDLIQEGVLSGKMAKEVFALMWETGQDPEAIIAEKGLRQVSDEGQLRQVLQDILQKEPDKVEAYRGGKDKLFGYFVGQAMKATQGQGNPTMVNSLLKELLDGSA